jgi:hypothetical protein
LKFLRFNGVVGHHTRFEIGEWHLERVDLAKADLLMLQVDEGWE